MEGRLLVIENKKVMQKTCAISIVQKDFALINSPVQDVIKLHPRSISPKSDIGCPTLGINEYKNGV